jgi:tetratricopeptide (TPR) repeat protein
MAGRLWRQVRRHRARSILAAGLLIALVLGGYLGLQVRAESQRRQELQYARLCVRAEHAVIATISAHGGSPDPGALFTEAIALAPDLPEAYLGRALLHTRPLQARLADLDAAQARGLPTRTWQVARAEFLGVPEPNLGAERETVPLHIYFEARRLADRQRWAEAQQELGRVLSARETGIALRYLALRLRVTACIKEDQHALALEDLLQMRALGDESASLCALIASQWRRLGESEMAETRFLEALEQAGKAGTEGSWLALCHDLHNFADHELLERAARAAVKAQPRSAKLHATLADALWHLGRHEEALAASDCALEIDPDRFSSHFQRGNALEALGRCEPALEAFDRAIGIDPESAAAHYNRGNALWSLGRIEESLAAYDRALDLDPQDGDAHGNRGDALVRLGRLEDAVIAFRRAFDLDPRADYQDKIGFALHSLGRNEEAVAAYEKALQLDDRSTYAMGGLAWGLATSTDPGVRNVPRAVAVARSGVALAPEDGGLWNTLGVALYRAGAWQESMSAFEKSMALGGGGTAYDWFFVAMLHARANREDKAREMYDKAVAWTKAHHPDDKELERFRSEAGEALASVAFGRR